MSAQQGRERAVDVRSVTLKTDNFAAASQECSLQTRPQTSASSTRTKIGDFPGRVRTPKQRGAHLPLVGLRRASAPGSTPRKGKRGVASPPSTASSLPGAGRARVPSPDFNAGLIDEWIGQLSRIHDLSNGQPCPGASVVGLTLSALSQLGHHLGEHRFEVQRQMLSYMEEAAYWPAGKSLPDGVPQADNEVMCEEIPKQYQGRLPCCVVTLRQQNQLSAFSANARRMQKLIRLIQGARHMGWNYSADAVLAWVLWSWRAASWILQDKSELRERFQQYAQRVVQDLKRPFVLWKITVVDARTARTLDVAHATTATLYSHARELDQLYMQHRQIEQDKKAAVAARLKLEEDLAERVARCAHAREVFEAQVPDLAKRLLGSAMNGLLQVVLEQADAGGLSCAWQLSRSALDSLLREGEQVEKLSAVAGHELVLGFVNYHMMKFGGLPLEEAKFEIGPKSPSEGKDAASRDAARHKAWCKIVRTTPRITNLDKDLENGVVLSTMYALLASWWQDDGILSASHLWALAEADSEKRLERICVALRSLLPMAATRSLVQRIHVDKGCEPLFMECFAAMVLHCPGLPLRQHAHRWDFFCTWGMRSLTAAAHHATTVPQGTASELGLDDPHPWSEESLSQRLTSELQKLASACHREAVCDFYALLDVGETLADLSSLSTSDLLLRWVDRKLDEDGGEPLSWGALKDGCWRRLFLLMRVVADDVSPLTKDAELSMASESRLAALVEWAGRCTAFPILSWESLAAQRMSVVIAFVASLFLSRPCLKPVPGSSVLQSHMDILQETLVNCTTLSRQDLTAKAESAGVPPMTQLCLMLNAQHKVLSAATAGICQMQSLQVNLESRVTFFMWELLGQLVPCGAPITERKEVAEVIKRRQVLPAQRVWELIAAEGVHSEPELFVHPLAWEGNPEAAATVQSILDVLRVHKDPFDAVFKQYASLDQRTWCSPAGQRIAGKGTEVLDLRGLLLMHREGHWRKYASPHQLEAIFVEVLSPRSSREASDTPADPDAAGRSPEEVRVLGGCAGKGLTRQCFAEALVLICLRGHLHAGATVDLRVDVRFKDFFTRHIDPLLHATHYDDWALFHEIFYDSATSMVLAAFEPTLRAIFEAYSEEATKMITYSGFQQMCNHAGLVGSILDEISPRVFRGLRAVQMCGLVDEASEHDGDQAGALGSSSDSDGEHGTWSGDVPRARQHVQRRIAEFPPTVELCFVEFAEAVLAVALYVDPNPFIRVSVRVERFLQRRLFRHLRTYHRSLVTKEADGEGLPGGFGGHRSCASLLEVLEEQVQDEHILSEVEEQLGDPSPKQAHSYKKEVRQHPRPRRGKA